MGQRRSEGNAPKFFSDEIGENYRFDFFWQKTFVEKQFRCFFAIIK